MRSFLEQLEAKPPVDWVPVERVDELTSGIATELDRLERDHAYKLDESTTLEGHDVEAVDPRDPSGERKVPVRANVRMSRLGLTFRTAFVDLFGRDYAGKNTPLGQYLEQDGSQLVEINYGPYSSSPNIRHPHVEHFMMLVRAALDGC